MKIYTAIIISLTLGLFYSLALNQQSIWESKQLNSVPAENHLDHYEFKTDADPYMLIEDDFSMQVTGKEHRYLHVGISYVEAPKENQEKQCIAAHQKDSNTDLSGS